MNYKSVLGTIIFIAACATFHWASAQNGIQTLAGSTPDVTLSDDRNASEQAERERIKRERQRANAGHDTARVDCYQRFQVNDCLSQARSKQNQQLLDLKRQETSLNDVQRKRRGAEQLSRVEEKTSPARQQEIALQRGKALQEDATRQQRQAQGTAPVPKAAAGLKPTGKAPQARSTTGVDIQARQTRKAAQRQETTLAAARAKAQSEERIKAAAAHAASVQSRVQQNKKPPSASLPIPLN